MENTTDARERDGAHCCAAAGLFRLLAGKWVLPVLHLLHQADAPLRFGELNKAAGSITTTELTKTLRLLASLGLVTRTHYGEIPPRVEYACTDLGRSLKGPLDGLAAWLETHRDQLQPVRPACEDSVKKAGRGSETERESGNSIASPLTSERGSLTAR